MSNGCDKVFYVRANLKKHAKVHGQETKKCQRKGPMNEHVNALKEVNKALRRFTKTVHCGEAPYTRCDECIEFKRHVNFMLE